MPALYSPKVYPPEIRSKLEAMPSLAIEIANRWLLGWPKATKALIADGTYLDLLTAQEEKERDVLLNATGMTHLARHEIAEMHGLSPKPPNA